MEEVLVDLADQLVKNSDVKEFLEEDYDTFATWYSKTVDEIKNPPAKKKRVDLTAL